jgi:hypothetical protein
MSVDANAHAARLATLRDLGALQGVMAVKARFYKEREPELAARFARASYAAINARMLIQAALMAERETAL